MMVSELTRKYWIDTLLGWAEDRLPPPQLDECRAALNFSVLVAEAVLAERQACARAVCPRCAAGEYLVYSSEHKRWSHFDQDGYDTCEATPIWERGRESEKAR